MDAFGIFLTLEYLKGSRPGIIYNLLLLCKQLPFNN